MIDLDHMDALVLAAEESSEYFNDCSVGYRAKPCLDGTFPSYHTLKYFAMPTVLRKLVKDSCDDFEKNIETYFLKFKEGERLAMCKGPKSCFFVCKAVLISGDAIVKKGARNVHMHPGDTVDINLNDFHGVEPQSPCTFLIEMQIRENFR